MVEQLQGLAAPDNQSPAAPAPSTKGSPDAAANAGTPSTWAETAAADPAFGSDDAAEANPRVSSTAVLLGLALAVAAAALWGMRQTGGSSVDNVPDQAERRIEQTLAQYAGSPSGPNAAQPAGALPSTQAVLERFQNDPRSRQVELAFLAKNPFLPLGEDAGTRRAKSERAKADEQQRQRDQRARRLRMEFRALTLQSVMNGARPVAVISGQLVRPGDRIGSFTVVSIDRRSAMLAAEGGNYRLMMAGPDLNSTER